MAYDAMWELRLNGTIEYHSEGEVRKIRVVSGFDSRTDEQKAAEYQFRKMRSAIKYHEVPEKTWHTDWKNQKTWYLPNGKWSKKGVHREVELKNMENGIPKGNDELVETLAEHQISLEHHD